MKRPSVQTLEMSRRQSSVPMTVRKKNISKVLRHLYLNLIMHFSNFLRYLRQETFVHLKFIMTELIREGDGLKNLMDFITINF